MPSNKVTIRSDGSGSNTHVYVDGVELSHATEVQVTLSARGPARVQVTMMVARGDVDLQFDGSAEVETKTV